MTESASPGRKGDRLLDLVAVMDRLRSPGGCPWDARQTHESLVEYLVEEAYEAVEAIETADSAGLREELGDLLLQVVFHARIAAEDTGWDIDDVAQGIVDKLVARHPHVFDPDFSVDSTLTPEQVESNWHAQKTRDKGRESVTDGIPVALPGLVFAGKVISRTTGLTDRLEPLEARAEAEAALENVTSNEQFGDLLLALVALGRSRGLDAESSVRDAARRRIRAARDAEGLS